MNKYPKIEITMYANSHGYTIQTQKKCKVAANQDAADHENTGNDS